MAAVDGAGPVTRSRIEAFDQTAAVLSSSAAQWRSQAQQLQQAADVYVDQINAPNGTPWSGETAVSYFDTAHADRLAVLPAITHVHAMADIAGRGGDQLLAAQEAALSAIAEAEADDFNVGEDLSVADTYASDSPTVRAARQAAAVSHRNYIAYRAALLSAENQRIAAQLNAGAAQMAGMAPAHWRQPVTEYAQPAPVNTAATAPTTTANRKGTIHAADRTWKQDPASPTPPVDPKDMSPEQLRQAWADFARDRDEYNARCARTFRLPAEQGPYDACVRDLRATMEREAALRARFRDLGLPEPPADRALRAAAAQPGTPGAEPPPGQPDGQEPPAAAGGGPHLIDEVPLRTDLSQIEEKFSQHAADFGVMDPRGRVGFDNFDRALKQLVDDPATMHIQGTYRGQPVILNYNPDSGLCVIENLDGVFVSGWKLGPDQVRNVLTRGSL